MGEGLGRHRLHKRRSLIFPALLPATGFLLVMVLSCSSGATSAEPATHRVGLGQPLAGTGAAGSAPMLLGAQRAAGDVKGSWALEGRRLELVVEDGRCSRRGGLADARQLVEIHGVGIVYFGGCSHETLGAVDYLPEQGVVLLTPLTSDGTRDFAFSNSQGRSYSAIADARGVKTVTLGKAIYVIQGSWTSSPSRRSSLGRPQRPLGRLTALPPPHCRTEKGHGPLEGQPRWPVSQDLFRWTLIKRRLKWHFPCRVSSGTYG